MPLQPIPLSGRDQFLYAKIDIDAAENPLRNILVNPKIAMQTPTGEGLASGQVSTVLFSFDSPSTVVSSTERIIHAFENTAVVTVQGPQLSATSTIPSRADFVKSGNYLRFIETNVTLSPTIKKILLDSDGGSTDPIHIRREGNLCFVHLPLTGNPDELVEYHLASVRDPEFLLLLLNSPRRPIVEIDSAGENTLPPSEATRFTFELVRTGSLSVAYQAVDDTPDAEVTFCGKFTAVLEPTPDGLTVVIYKVLVLPWPPPVE